MALIHNEEKTIRIKTLVLICFRSKPNTYVMPLQPPPFMPTLKSRCFIKAFLSHQRLISFTALSVKLPVIL